MPAAIARNLPGPRFRLRIPSFGRAGAAALMLGVTPAVAQQADPADTAGPQSDVPVISSEDPGTGYVVMESPSEPVGSYDALAPEVVPVTPPTADMGVIPPGAALSAPPPPAAPQPQAPAAMTAPAPVELPGNGFVQRSMPRAEITTSPVLVELFTSQGCSSCPPADTLLAELAARPDVMTLTWHVDYWDYLGWPDGFARPEFTQRQKAYARVTGERALYTPQIVVGGMDTLIDLGPASLDALVDSHQSDPAPISVRAVREDGRVTIELAPGPRPTGAATVDLVRFLPTREVAIGGGENSGRVMTYRNVVVSLERLAVWDGRGPLRLTVTPGAGAPQALPDDTRHAVLVQQMARGRSLGPVLAAVPVD